MDPGFVVALHIGPDVQKIVRGDGLEQFRGQAAAPTRAHVFQGERDEGDVGAAGVSIEWEGDSALQGGGVDFQVDHQDAFPGGEEEGFAAARQHAGAGLFTWPVGHLSQVGRAFSFTWVHLKRF
jgi:hypothetical protein